MGSATVKDIAAIINGFAPENMAADFDNTGFQIGNINTLVTGIVISLDCTSAVIDFASDNGCNLIITHHPLIFSPLKAVRNDDAVGSMVIRLIENNTALYSMHTNFDRADDGTDDILAQAIGLKEVERLEKNIIDGKSAGFGRIGKLDGIRADELKKRLKNAVGGDVIMTADDNKIINVAASAAGAGGSFSDLALSLGADIFITGEMNYHTALDAKRMGMDIMLCSHQRSEQISLNILKSTLQKALFGVKYDIRVILAPFEPLWH